MENDSQQRGELKYSQGNSSAMRVFHTYHTKGSCGIKPLERSLPKKGGHAADLISAHLRILRPAT